MSHLRFSGLPHHEQHDAMLDIISTSPLLMDVLSRVKQLNLPDWYVVSGAIYNLVWNVLTDRPESHGIKDIDLFYYDASDMSYEAEDAHIQAGHIIFEDLPLPVEIRNQARVHLWFEKHFGQPYSPLKSSQEGIDRFAAKTHAVGVRLEDKFELYAPYGLEPIFGFMMVPNRSIDNRATYHAKAIRAQQHWPELTMIPW